MGRSKIVSQAPGEDAASQRSIYLLRRAKSTIEFEVDVATQHCALQHLLHHSIKWMLSKEGTLDADSRDRQHHTRQNDSEIDSGHGVLLFLCVCKHYNGCARDVQHPLMCPFSLRSVRERSC